MLCVVKNTLLVKIEYEKLHDLVNKGNIKQGI